MKKAPVIIAAECQPNALDRYLTLQQAAHLVGFCVRTLRRRIQEGLLPAVRLATPGGRGHLRVRRGDLLAFLHAGTVEPVKLSGFVSNSDDSGKT